MKVTQKQLLERIEELEKQVRELQARPVYVPVFPNPQPNPWQPPYPYPQPYITYTSPSTNIPNYMCSSKLSNGGIQ